MYITKDSIMVIIVLLVNIFTPMFKALIFVKYTVLYTVCHLPAATSCILYFYVS